jgi:uncharacterized transporter YbjL
MIRIVYPSRVTSKVNSLRETGQSHGKGKLAPADRTVLSFCICLTLAVGCGTATSIGLICAGAAGLRTGVAAGGVVFGVVLAALMIWRALMTR